MNKVIRFQIIKPIFIDWKLFGDILYNIQNDTRNLKNKALQLCWEYQGFSSEYKNTNGEYPNSKEVLGYSNMMGHCYNKLKDDFVKMNSGNQSQSLKVATDKWKSDLKEVLRGDRSIPSYKKDCAIDIKSTAIKIHNEKQNNNWIAKLSLLSNTYKKELGLKSGQIDVLLSTKDNNQKVTLERIVDGEYKICASQIVKKKNKWFLNLCYSFEPKKKYLDENNIMGIDMGIVYPVYMAFNNSMNRYSIKGGEIEQFRKQIEKRKNELYDHGKYCGQGRIGHGTKTRIKPIKFATDKVANFRDTTNHKYSKYIIDMAVKNNCGTIQMEDLTGINKDNIFLKNWSYFDLQTKIEYKAKEVGINVIKVSPRYTSQRCSKCGNIHKENRQDQATFECSVCGFKSNADFNAARNIATKDIDKIISETLKYKEKSA